MRKLAVLAVTVFFALLGSAQTNLSLPAGTAVKLKLQTTLASFTSKAGYPFAGRVTEPVMQDGKTIIPIGATVEGRVTKVSEPRRIAGKPTIGISPQTLVLPNGDRYTLNATLVDTSLRNGADVNEEGQFKGAGRDSSDLKEIAVSTGGGMAIGGLTAGGKGVLVGGAIGATATIAHWLGKHRSAILPAGTELVMELSHPMTLTAGGAGQ
jgi:hypothetical protein